MEKVGDFDRGLRSKEFFELCRVISEEALMCEETDFESDPGGDRRPA